MDLFDNNREEVLKMMEGFRFTDEQTIGAIRSLKQEYNYVACPHTAIAWLAADAYQKAHPDEAFTSVFLSTAHPCKFPESIPADVATGIRIPDLVQQLANRSKQSSRMDVDYTAFKQYLMNYNPKG
jgi:threonine synthase